jgi:hypothetical protein
MVADNKNTMAKANESPTTDSLSIKESIPDAEANVAVRNSSIQSSSHIPLKYKICAILLVSGISFGSSWSSGVTGAMKTTLKKARIECEI